MPPVTRVYVLMLMLVTAVDVSVGKIIDAGATFSMDWGKTFKVRSCHIEGTWKNV